MRSLSGVLRQVVYGLLPTGAIWLILTRVAGYPPENVAVRVAETGFALTTLYVVLKLVQAVLAWMIGNEQRVPKLLLDTVRIGVAMLWSAVVISRIWEINLSSLIAAMGVGSIVLGFALQEFLGNMLSGLGLLSANKFRIGDWLIVDGRAQRVVAFDWRSATLIDAAGSETVVANSTLAKGNLVIDSEGRRNRLVEAVAFAMGRYSPRGRARGDAGGGGDGSRHAAGNPAALLCDGHRGPARELSGLGSHRGSRRNDRAEGRVPQPVLVCRAAARTAPGGPARRYAAESSSGWGVVEASGALRRHPYLMASLGPLQRYRRGDVLLAEGSAPAEALVVIGGTLAVLLPGTDGATRLETLGPGQLLVLQETINGTTSAVRVVADSHADVVAIPRAALIAAIHEHPDLARDIGALAESRRQAMAALQRSIARAA